MTIDIPTHYLPRLEQALQRSGLQIQPYIKGGFQRWQLAPRSSTQATCVPDTIIAAGIAEVA